jgi:ankyrin repeat protein
MAVNGTDKWLETPLHRACFSGAEVAVNYLCSWTKNLNIKDYKGYTPLHIAVWSGLINGNLRPMKNLLLRGASRRAKVHLFKNP